MFEPNSIKSLLTRRHSAKIQNQPEGKIESIKTFDPDYDSIVETKIMIKGMLMMMKILTIKLTPSGNGENIRRP